MMVCVSREATGGGGPEDTLEPCLTVSAVARRLGVAPATLRTWDRRYGLGPTRRRAGSHRRYTEQDVARLEAMRRLVLDGVPAAEAARLAAAGAGAGRPAGAGVPALARARPVTACRQHVHVLPPVRQVRYRTLPGHSGRLALPAVNPLSLRAALAVPFRGGRGLRLPGAAPQVRGLASAVLALDAGEIRRALTRSVAVRGVVLTWEELLRPLLAAVGLRWAATGRSVEAEHLLCDVARSVLGAAGAARGPTAGRPALLACGPRERHDLPLAVLDAALAEHGVDVRCLGADLPPDALAAAVRRTGPAALLLWSQAPSTADPAVFGALPSCRPPTTLLAGGPGWAAADLPARVTHVPDLTAAVLAVCTAVGV
jgi:MerR family transcriptional regulator, light-induced transcriptional regulator